MSDNYTPWSNTQRIWPYLVFIIFCLLSAGRDSLSEMMFKDVQYGAHPAFILFIFSVTTQTVAAFIIGGRVFSGSNTQLLKLADMRWDLIYLNFFTLVAYLTYFLAISTALGAGLNAFVDYGSGPLFTALVGVILLREKLDQRFFVSFIISGVGLLTFIISRINIDDISHTFWFGFTLALLSSLAGGFYRVYFKRLLNSGIDKTTIVFFRLIGLSIVLGLFILWEPELFRIDLLRQTVMLGLFGFTLPLFLVLFVIQKLSIASFSLLLFLVPVLTYLFSWILGYVIPNLVDLVACLVIFIGIIVYEKSTVQLSKQTTD